MILTLAFYLAIGAAIVLPSITPDGIRTVRDDLHPYLPPFFSDRAVRVVIGIAGILTILTWPLLLVSAMLRRG